MGRVGLLTSTYPLQVHSLEVDTDALEFGIYLPQVGFAWADLLARARWIEELGFDSLWLFDHLFFDGPPLDVLEAWTTATALLNRTDSLRVGHLVLCANFRHPVLLGKMIATLGAINPGRFLLGLGSGSIEAEHLATGLPWATFAERTDRLAETLAVVTRMMHGQNTELHGRFYDIADVPNLPCPPPAPLMIGGKGDRTLDLVARYADVWNCPTYALGELPELTARLAAACAKVGRDPATVRTSTQSVLVLVPHEGDIPAARALAEKRFGGAGWGLHEAGLIGTPDIIVAKLRESIELGVRSFVFFLHDRCERATLELLASQVVPRLRESYPT